MKISEEASGRGVRRISSGSETSAVHREGEGAVVCEEVPVALQVGKAQAVGWPAKGEQLHRGRRQHRLVVIKVGLREDVSRVKGKAVAHPLRYPRHCGQNRRGRMRQALVRPGWIEANPCRLGLQLGDSRVELLREDTSGEEVDLLDSQVSVGVQSHAHDSLYNRKRTERAELNECSRSDGKR